MCEKVGGAVKALVLTIFTPSTKPINPLNLVCNPKSLASKKPDCFNRFANPGDTNATLLSSHTFCLSKASVKLRIT